MTGRTTSTGARERTDAGFGARPGDTRHPLVALAMVLPLAVLLAVAFGGWGDVVARATSVAGLIGF